jgi:hypothetical protein
MMVNMDSNTFCIRVCVVRLSLVTFRWTVLSPSSGSNNKLSNQHVSNKSTLLVTFTFTEGVCDQSEKVCKNRLLCRKNLHAFEDEFKHICWSRRKQYDVSSCNWFRLLLIVCIKFLSILRESKLGGYEPCSKIDIDSITHLRLWSIIVFDLSQSRVQTYLVWKCIGDTRPRCMFRYNLRGH